MPASSGPVVAFTGKRLSIGRSNSNDIVLDDVNVSRFHAEIAPVGDDIELRDLESRCGTRVDGKPVKRTVIRDGAHLGIGPFDLVFDGSRFVRRNQRGALRLDAAALGVSVDGRPILDDVSLAVAPGELVAIIGESGSGKTTLIRALAGVSRPSSGTVTLNEEPVTARLTDVGYVPQDEIVHSRLTVREALGYAARLRLPRDMAPRERESVIERVLTEMSLEDRADLRIGSLSGGQRKRAGVASELLNRPSLLFLDEPTTGLDPGLEGLMMSLFRELAQPGERAVVVVTHATRSLELCNRLAVMGRGGQLTFYGPPAQALTFFKVDTYDGIYGRLLERPAAEWRRRFEVQRPRPAAPAPGPTPEPGPAGSPQAKQRGGPQVGVLASRYLRLFSRDLRNVAILFGQVPVIALATAFLFHPGVFDRAGVGLQQPGDPRYAIQVLFILATTAIWFGSISSAREIVKERSVIQREAAIGVRWSSYLASKALVLFAIVAVQTAALSYFVFAVRPLDEPAGTYATVIGLLVVTSFAAVAMGLLISATVSSEDQATSLIPLTLIPQLLLAGAIVPVARMSEPLASISSLMMARWSLAGAGSAINMNDRIAADPRIARLGDYGQTFFDTTPRQVIAILIVFMAVFFAATLVALARRRPAGARVGG